MKYYDKYSIERTNNGITIIRDSDVLQNELFITRSDLTRLDEELLQNKLFSPRIIFDLLDKEWVSKTMLYEIATHIKSEEPNVKFDWYETFRLVESEFLKKEHRRNDDQEKSFGEAVTNVVYEILEGDKMWSQSNISNLINSKTNEGLATYKLV